MLYDRLLLNRPPDKNWESYLSNKTYAVGTHETVLLSTKNMF